MSTGYGSDNPDCGKVDHLGDASRPRPTSSKWRKAVVATAGAALCFGGALVMYEGWNGPRLASSLSAVNMATTTMTTDQTNLMSGKEILLRIKGKTANLCADDGGSTKAASTYITGQPCNANNPNQLFVYDSPTSQFKSATKQDLCIDDGGGWAGLTLLRLSKCNTKSSDQRFKYDPSTQLLENPSKAGYCIDDGSAAAAGTKYTIWGCNSKSDNQRFEVLSQSTLAAEQTKVMDAVTSGAKFILRIAGKDGLCASGGGTATAPAKFTPVACNKQSKDQLFTYDSTTKRIKSSEKPGLCMYDGGYNSKKWSTIDVTLASCSSTSADQSFSYDAPTMAFKQASKTGLCLDEDNGGWFTGSRLVVKECDAYSNDQHFEFVLQTDPVPTTAAPTTSTWTTSTSAQASTSTYPEVAAYTQTTSPQVAAAPQTITYPELSTQTSYPSTAAQETSVSSAANQVSQQEATAATSTFTTSAPESQTQSAYEVQSTSVPVASAGETNSQVTTQTAAMEPGSAMPEEGQMTSTGMMESGMTTPEQGQMTEPGLAMPEEGQMTSTSMMESGMTTPEQGQMTEPGLAMPEEGQMTSTSMMESGMTTPEQGQMTVPGLAMPKEGGAVATAAITAVDASVEDFVGQDWNLLAPSESTLPRVNTDNSAFVHAADIFEYLQSIKDRADLEHEAVMYRFKRTFECASAGLQTLDKDSVSEDQYTELVRWMYEHCAAGNTNVAPPFLPPLPASELNAPDEAPLVDDPETDVKRQFMTKLDFYYEIKSHFDQKSEQLDGEIAATHLRSTETKEQEQKMVDCINEAAKRFGYPTDSPSYASSEHLKAAIAWVDDSCMKP